KFVNLHIAAEERPAEEIINQSKEVIPEKMLNELDYLWKNTRSFAEKAPNKDFNVDQIDHLKDFKELEIIQKILFSRVKDKVLNLGVNLEESTINNFSPIIQNQETENQNLMEICERLHIKLDPLRISESRTSSADLVQVLNGLFHRINLEEIENTKFEDRESRTSIKLQENIFGTLKYMHRHKFITTADLKNFFKNDKTIEIAIVNACSNKLFTIFMKEASEFVLVKNPSSFILKKILEDVESLDILTEVLNKNHERKINYYFLKSQFITYSKYKGFPEQEDEVKFSELMNNIFANDSILELLEKHQEDPSINTNSVKFKEYIEQASDLYFAMDAHEDPDHIEENFEFYFLYLLISWVNERYGRDFINDI
ncbi:hypothetical protein PTTG_29929, partial [Puccinia triticina 1-1 BBBD Race 1]